MCGLTKIFEQPETTTTRTVITSDPKNLRNIRRRKKEITSQSEIVPNSRTLSKEKKRKKTTHTPQLFIRNY